jgi:transposase/transposase IS116/IS110/IS902 family protein
VQALIASGYAVYAINPLQVARYRERHGTAGAKSKPGDAPTLTELVRLDRAHHRPVAGDSELAEHVKVLARTHQSMIWSRQRQTNTWRSMLREFYPGALQAFKDLAGRDALAVLAIAPSPEAGRRLSQSKIAATLRRAGRQRNLDTTAARIQTALRAPQLAAHPGVVGAYTASVKALVAVIAELVAQTVVLRGEVEAGFGRHPDAEIYLSQPGLGPVLGARVLAEFEDDPTRYANPKARKNYSGMAPIPRASGTKRVVLARCARNRRLADALYQRAFAALNTSAGARAYYDRQRARGATHHQALRPRPTGSSASCTAACATEPPTTRPPPGHPWTRHRSRPRLDVYERGMSSRRRTGRRRSSCSSLGGAGSRAGRRGGHGHRPYCTVRVVLLTGMR